mgnify:CR=1 FL=1
MQSHSYFSLSDQWSSAVKCGLLTATNYLPLCVQDMFLNWPVMLRALDNGAAGVVLTLLHSKAPGGGGGGGRGAGGGGGGGWSKN